MRSVGFWILSVIIVLSMVPFHSLDALQPELPLIEMNVATPKDILVVNDLHKCAFFGWFKASEMPLSAWDLLNRTLVWAVGDLPRNETRVVFFSNLRPDDDSAAVYAWFVSNGFDELLIDQYNYSDAEGYSSSFYDNFHLAIYWNRTDINATNIVLSGIPFITVAAGQTDEMGIGTGVATMHASSETCHIVNVNYYPTYTYPGGPFTFENTVEFETIEAASGGKVLIKAAVDSVSPFVEMSCTQGVVVLPSGDATMTFSIDVPSSPLADIYREHFFSNVSSLETGIEYDLPENKSLQVTFDLEEEAIDVSLPGDINGDGKTDIFDIVQAAGAYGALLGDDQWDFMADVNWDGEVDIFDIVGMAVHYGKTHETTGSLCVVGYFNGTEVNSTNVFYMGPQGASNPTNISTCGHTWFGLYPGLYTIYGAHNGNHTSALAEVTPQETCTAQLDFGGTERPPLPIPYIPVREDFHQAIEAEQFALLGFDINVAESKITPLKAGGEVTIALTAYAPQVAEFISFWRIPVGPHDELTRNTSVNFLYWKVQYLQMMLRKLPGEQVYDGGWTIEFALPSTVSLLNGGELLGLDWTIDFGGGTFMEANITLDTTVPNPKIYLSEIMVVTEQEITIPEANFTDAVTEYRVFNIDYVEMSGMSTGELTQKEQPRINLRYANFEKTFKFTLPIPEYRRTWSAEPITATVHVRSQMTIEWRVTGRFDWLLRSLKRFGTWVNVSASIDARSWGHAADSGEKTFGPHTFGSVTLTRWSFAIGPVPVWATLRLSAHGKVRVNAHGNVSYELIGIAEGWFRTGVHWHRGSGFDTYWATGFDAGAVVLNEVDADITITPSASLRLALLFYDVAGPFVEGEVYTPLTLTYPPAEIESFSLRFRVNYGVTYADWLKSLLGLKDWTGEIAHWTIWTY